MKLLRNNKYLNMFAIATLATSTIVLFQNCSNYTGQLALEGGSDQLKSSSTVESDNPVVHIDPIDSHTDLSSTTGGMPADGTSVTGAASTDPSSGGSVQDIPQAGGAISSPSGGGGTSSSPGVIAGTDPSVTSGMTPEVTAGKAPEVAIGVTPGVTPGVEDLPATTEVGIIPHPPLAIVDEKPECFTSATDATSGIDNNTTNVVSSDGEVVVSSDLRPVVSTDQQVVVYGGGSHSSSTTTTSCTGSSCSQSGSPGLNCSFYVKGLDKKSVLQLSSSHNNLNIIADKCGVKTIFYDGAEPITLSSVKAKDINICGNIIIKNLEARGGVELINVQVNFASIKGNISSYKLDNGFKILVSSKKAGILARTCSVNNKYEITSL